MMILAVKSLLIMSVLRGAPGKACLHQCIARTRNTDVGRRCLYREQRLTFHHHFIVFKIKLVDPQLSN